MAVELISKIIPKAGGSFPMLEDIHLQGGMQIRATLASRDSIPSLNRKEGMLVYVVSTSITYRLAAGLLNADWAVDNGSGLLGGNGIAINAGTISVDLSLLSGLEVVGGLLKVKIGGGIGVDPVTGGIKLAYSNVLFDSLSSVGTLNLNGNTDFLLVTVPILDAAVTDGYSLLINGVDSQVRVNTIPATPGEWTLSTTTLTIFGDVTANNDKYRLRYLS